MNIALCAAFLEEDVWESRLRAALSQQRIEITECNSAGALSRMLELKPFSLLIVALNGVAGLEAVRELREKAPNTPLLWISDEDYSLFGYQYRVTGFLHRPVSDAQLREALSKTFRKRRGGNRKMTKTIALCGIEEELASTLERCGDVKLAYFLGTDPL